MCLHTPRLPATHPFWVHLAFSPLTRSVLSRSISSLPRSLLPPSITSSTLLPLTLLCLSPYTYVINLQLQINPIAHFPPPTVSLLRTASDNHKTLRHDATANVADLPSPGPQPGISIPEQIYQQWLLTSSSETNCGCWLTSQRPCPTFPPKGPPVFLWRSAPSPLSFLSPGAGPEGFQLIGILILLATVIRSSQINTPPNMGQWDNGRGFWEIRFLSLLRSAEDAIPLLGVLWCINMVHNAVCIMVSLTAETCRTRASQKPYGILSFWVKQCLHPGLPLDWLSSYISQ